MLGQEPGHFPDSVWTIRTKRFVDCHLVEKFPTPHRYRINPSLSHHLITAPLGQSNNSSQHKNIPRRIFPVPLANIRIPKQEKKHRKKLGNDLDRLGWKLGRQQEKENVTNLPHHCVTFGPLTSKAQSAILYSSDQVSVTLRGLRPQGGPLLALLFLYPVTLTERRRRLCHNQSHFLPMISKLIN